jgi:hypothetical protein
MDIIGRHVSKLSGYATAVPTPFDDDGNADVAAFELFCHRQIQAATALVVCGTTGEAPTLSESAGSSTRSRKASLRACDSRAAISPVSAVSNSRPPANGLTCSRKPLSLGARRGHVQSRNISSIQVPAEGD